MDQIAPPPSLPRAREGNLNKFSAFAAFAGEKRRSGREWKDFFIREVENILLLQPLMKRGGPGFVALNPRYKIASKYLNRT